MGDAVLISSGRASHALISDGHKGKVNKRISLIGGSGRLLHNSLLARAAVATRQGWIAESPFPNVFVFL